MTFRRKILLFFFLSLAIECATLLAVSHLVVQKGFSAVGENLSAGFGAIEKSNAKDNAQRVANALDTRLQGLATLVTDWAEWDDTYLFVSNRNSEYIKSNFNEKGLASLSIDIALVADNAGKTVYSTAHGRNELETHPLEPEIAALLLPTPAATPGGERPALKSGLLYIDGKLALIATKAIKKSDGSGQTRGTFTFGTYLGEEELARVAAVTNLKFNVYPANGPLPDDVRKALGLMGTAATSHEEAFDAATFVSYALLADLTGDAAICLRVETPRDINQQGNRVLAALWSSETAIYYALAFTILLSTVLLSVAIYFGYLGSVNHEKALEGKNSALRAEIAERKKAEQQLLEAKEQWETAFNSINQVIFVLDTEMKILQSNENACRNVLGRAVEDVVGRNCAEVFHGAKEIATALETYKAALDEPHQVARFFDPVYGKNFELETFLRHDADGKFIGFIQLVLVSRQGDGPG